MTPDPPAAHQSTAPAWPGARGLRRALHFVFVMFLATGGLPAGLLSADIAMVGGGGAGSAPSMLEDHGFIKGSGQEDVLLRFRTPQ